VIYLAVDLLIYSFSSWMILSFEVSNPNGAVNCITGGRSLRPCGRLITVSNKSLGASSRQLVTAVAVAVATATDILAIANPIVRAAPTTTSSDSDPIGI
jgi:hypothetical protein